ncbi:hypothetical protein [Cryptosporangium minutisporangium]|uniref:Uncharacterized protein n=1 Tax=Cryptosporangium minutisporangium TaxID=113569 RepID=A0ABP6SW16_9ACTN
MGADARRGLTIAPDDGPWCLDTGGRIPLSRFEVAVYADAVHYLGGGEPDSCQSTLAAVATDR